MRVVLTSLALAVLFLVIGGLGFIYSGLYDVAATDTHWPMVRWGLEEARARSIKAHAKAIAAPAALDDPGTLLIGTEHFAAHCAVCHGAPGVPKGDIAHGLYPQPPNLAGAAKFYTAGELFWILKNGIKMTGMPAWNDHSDEELWATVAFLEKLPTMSEQDYAKLVMASIQSGGHHHHDGPDEGGPDK
jgi:mono/diheme cytochrome c family protein